VTDSDVRTENWAPFPDARYYEADALSGNVRSLPRTIKGRFHPGRDPLKPHHDPDGYLRINYTDDNGVRHHNVSVARMVLMAHNPDGWFPGAVACHEPGRRRDDCRLAALRWDTEETNRIEALEVRMENSPPKPKPPKVCPRCGAEHQDKGRNCHGCVVQLGVNAAVLLVKGTRLQVAADQLGYPAEPLHHLAVVYGGLRHHLAEDSPLQPVAARDLVERYDDPALASTEGALDALAVITKRNRKPKASWLRRVINGARGSRRNSDGA
jgi:hypothetical protein